MYFECANIRWYLHHAVKEFQSRISVCLRLNYITSNFSETWSSTFFCSLFVGDVVADLLHLSQLVKLDLVGHSCRLFSKNSCGLVTDPKEVHRLDCGLVEDMFANLVFDTF